MLKRTLSLLLAFVMVFSLLPVNALAEETAPDEGESLLLEPAEIVEEEPETTPPSETEEKNIIEETEEAPVPETQAPTVPETAPETVPETVPETAPEAQPETVPETEPEQLLDAAGEAESVLAENSTWILNETKELTLSGTNNPFGSDAPNYTFTFTPTENGRYIFYWPSENCHGNGPHVVVKDSEGRQHGSGNVYASFHGTAGMTYTIAVYSCYDGEYTANITLAKATVSGSIYFQNDSVEGYVGQRFWRDVSRSPGNYEHGQITWVSNDENIVRITNPQFSALEFEMVGPGEATITATDAHGQSASFTVIVADIDAVDIQLDSTVTGTIPAESSVYYRFTAPETGKYIIQLDYQDGYVPNTTVECGGIRIAGDGSDRVQFSAEAGKEYIITMENWQGTEMGLSFRLMQAVPLQSIGLDYYPLTNGFVGEELGFSVTVSPGNADIESLTWESSDESVVSIGDRHGLYQSVNLVGPGTATVTVSAPGCTPLKITYTVSAVSGSVALNGTFTADLQRDEKTAFYFTPDTDGNYTVYETGGMDSYIEVYEISEIGNWHNGSGNGSATFWANAGDKCLIVGQACQYEPYEYTYCVAEAVEPTGISLDPASYTGYVGEVFWLNVKPEPVYAMAPEVEWSSSNPDVASVTGGGRVQLRKAGTATITAATSGDNPLTATCTVTVKAPVALTVGSTKTVTLPAGSSVGYQFTAPGNYSYTFWDQNNFDGISLTVSDSNGEWITGGSIGKFTAEKGETYLICVTNESTESQICKFIIKQDVNATSISLPYTSETAAVGDEFELWVGFEPINAIGEEITFTLDNDCAEILEQQPYGYIRVKMNQAGTVKLTATSKTTNLTASCTFTVLEAGTWELGEDKDVSFTAGESQVYRFTAPADSGYIVWEDNSDRTWIEVCNQQGEYLGMSGGGFCQFDAKEGQTYRIKLCANSDEAYEAAFHLETLTEPTGIKPLYGSDITAYVGDEIFLPLAFTPGNAARGQISWASSNTDAVEVVEDEYVNGYGCFIRLKAPGDATITATHQRVDGVSTKFHIKVLDVDTIALDSTVSVTLEGHGSTAAYDFTAPSSGTYVIYDETNQYGSVEVVSGDEYFWGDNRVQFTAQKGQTYRVVFHHWDDRNEKGEVTYSYVLTKAVPATGIRLSEDRVNGLPGDTRYLNVLGEPVNADLSGLTWSIDNKAVAVLVGENATNREIQLVGQGTATVTVRLGDLEVKCPITVGAEREAISVGDSKEISLKPMESVGFTFTPDHDGNYYFYEENRDWVTIVVWSEDGSWVDGTSDGRVRILDAKAGTTYYITVTHDMYGVAGVAKDFTLHLEEAVKATGISLSKTGIDTRYVYPGTRLWVIAYTNPLNGYQGQLEWSVSEEYENCVTFVEEEYDPRGDGLCLEIHDDAPAGKMVVTCTDTENPLLTATLNIEIKSKKSILLGENYSVTQHNQENDLATFTPEEDGTYILKASTDVIVWVYTDDEDIHTPDGPETEMLLELKAGVTYNVESVLLGEDGNMTAGDYDLRIIQDGINPLSFTSDHISIEQNTTKSLGLSVEPEALSDLVTYKSSDAAIVKVDENGEITTSETPGSAYITATLTFGSRIFTAVCRVDVISDDEIKGAQFSTTAPTVELYKSSYTTITAVPYKEITEGRSTIKESVNSPITKVEFDSENSDYTTLNSLFDLEIAGSQTVRIVPKQEEIDKIFNGALSVKSSYTVKLTFTFNDDVTVTTPFKLTIKKTVPTLKASKLAFNSFITGDTRSVVLTGGIVEGISENEAMQGNKNNALGDWLELSDDTLSLKPGITGKKSGNVYLYVDVAGWSVPAKVTVPVSVAYTAPSLKLSATSVNISSSNSKGIDLKLLCGKKGQTLEQLGVNGISVDESETEFSCKNFDLKTGSFTLVSTDQYAQKAKSVTLRVSFTNTSESYPLTVKVTPKDATLAAKPASVKLNAYRGDSAVIGLTPSPADYKLESLEDLEWELYKVVNRKNEETAELDVDFYDGALHVSTTDGTALGTTYKLVINAIGNEQKKTTITLTTLTEKQSVITASAKVTGSVDLTFPASYAVIQPTFTNYTNGDYALIDFEITNSKGVVQEGYERFFRLENMDGQYRLSVANPEDQPAPGTYYLRPILLLGDGKSPDKTGVVKFTVKRTAVSLKASATKIILNKDIGDWATVDISCLTKGYDFVEPEVIKYSSGLDVVFLNGMLHIRTGDAAYGKTHTITLQARDVKEDKEIKVSVVIPKQGSKVGATLKAKGTIDLVRDTTSVVITPSYTNYSGQGDLTPELKIQKYEVGDRKYENGKDVTGTEFYIDKNDDGTFTVTRVPGANIDLKQYKYRAEMTFTGKSGIDNLLTIPAVALPLKSNTVKATVSGTPVLYKADKYSRASFRLNIADATVNAIEAVESTNPLYQIEDYGNGEYAICFNTSSWTAATKYPTSVTLNVFLDGNENAAAKVTLKLSLK